MTVICPYCGKSAEYVDSSVVYSWRSYGMIYWCGDCDAYVGVHKGTAKPKGTLANAELRGWRKAAHMAFDPYWKGKERKVRRWAYEWLAEEMGLPEEETHIAMFDIEQCKEAIRICEEERNRGQEKVRRGTRQR